MVTVAVELLNDGKAREQETAEAFRRSKAAREAFAQGMGGYHRSAVDFAIVRGLAEIIF